MEQLLAPFSYDFMQRAFAAAFIVGLLCPIMGTYVVLRKLSFMGEGIAHASFLGIAIAYVLGFGLALGAACVAVFMALTVGFVHRRGRVSLDSVIGVVFTALFALGLLITGRIHVTMDLQSFLFGSILGVSKADVITIAIVGLAIITSVAALWRPLLYTSFDPQVARAAGINTAVIDYILLVLLALTIVLALQSVGIVLVSALLITPAAAAAQVTRRFGRMMLIATVIGVLSSVGGLYFSYLIGCSSGPTIVLLATLFFFLTFGLNVFRARMVRRIGHPPTTPVGLKI